MYRPSSFHSSYAHGGDDDGDIRNFGGTTNQDMIMIRIMTSAMVSSYLEQPIVTL